jgi:hypothetical protein
MHFNEINIKGERQMSFVTIVKDYQKTTGLCGSKYDEFEIDQAYCDGLGLNFFKQDIPNAGNQQYCFCSKLKNLYPLGIEKLSLNVQHTYEVPGVAYPKTKNKNREALHGSAHNRFNIKTHICKGEYVYNSKTNCLGSNRYKTIRSKNNVGMLLEEWLDLVGIKSLEENNHFVQQGKTPFRSQSILPFRTTGMKIKLTFHYLSEDGFSPGKMAPDDIAVVPPDYRVTCFVYAKLIKSYQSFGSDVVYTNDMSNKNYDLAYALKLNTTEQTGLGEAKNEAMLAANYPILSSSDSSLLKSAYHDRYYRGIKFEFEASGAISYTEMSSFTLLIVATAVYFTFAGMLIQAIINYGWCYACKHVYKTAQDDVITVGREHAKTAAQAIVALNSFEKIRDAMKPDPDDPSEFSFFLLFLVFSHPMFVCLHHYTVMTSLLFNLISCIE